MYTFFSESFVDVLSSSRPPIITHNIVLDILDCILQSPEKYICKLSQLLGLSYSSKCRLLKNHSCLCKITSLRELKERGIFQRVRCCGRLRDSLLPMDRIFWSHIYTTELWFYLSSYVNSRVIKEVSYNIRRLVCGAPYHGIG